MKTLRQEALAGLVVLDMAGPLGNYCGKLFADLGADVILVEPTGGAPTRAQAPFREGAAFPDASLVFSYQNTSKRSLVLDVDDPRGQAVLRRLVRKSSLLIESEQPGAMQRRGLGYERLRAENPALVMTSVTAFGQDGPFAHWQATDLTAMGMGGMLYLAGYPDTAPMVACGEQAIGAANLFSAVASLAAVFAAESSGAGQQVDVSMQECVVLGMENAMQYYDLERTVRKRNAGTQRLAGTGVFACRDGYVYMMAGGVGSNKFWSTTADWLVDEGVEGAEVLQEPRWLDQAFLASDEAKQIFGRIFSPYALQRTKAQLAQTGRQCRIPIAPICDASDIADSAQRKHRDFFVDVPSADGACLRMPGAPYLLSETPWRIRGGAPRLGEHTAEILAWAGLSPEEQQQLYAQGVVQ